MIIDWQTAFPAGDYAAIMQTAADSAIWAKGIKKRCGVSLSLVDDETIRAINRDKRGVDSATDVLSFPALAYKKGATLRDGDKRLRTLYDDSLNARMLGDIVINLPQVIRQAEMYGHSARREAAYMVVHAVCHLMGYDHMTDEDKKEMRMMEEKALSAMGLAMEADVPVTDEALLALAISAKERSYSPYSNFPVGAALLCADGRVYQGCNIENASFGLSNCAERTAVFKAVSDGAYDFVAIAIAADTAAPWPCGACRQVLNEFAPSIRVMVTWAEGKTEEMPLSALLPNGFGPKALETKTGER